MIRSLVCLTALLLTGAYPACGDDSRPNVILIMADDIGYECFGCYGSEQYSTPHIDRMARRGMRFTHCYSQPLCTPSRVKLMTGLSNVRNYAAFSVLRRDQKTVGQYFHDAGYHNAIAGKWQLLGAEHYSKQFRGKGSWPQDCGFDHLCLWQVDRLGERYHEPLLWIDGENRQFDANDYGPEVCADSLIDFMKQHKDQPFFVYYPMILVHSPFVPTPDSESLTSKNRQQNFEDMVAYMDQLVGRIVQATEDLDIAENTLILFTGDNGTHKTIISTLHGQEIQGGKGLMTDAGTHVPLVALWPGVVPEGSVSDTLVDFSDFLPTVMEATGQTVPDGLDGQSFLPQLRGETGTPREWIHIYYCPRPEKTPPQQFVRDRRWKLYDDGRFFDVEHDVIEQQPIADPSTDSDAAAAHAKLTKALASFPEDGQSLLDYGDASAALRLTLPPQMYAVVGQEMGLYIENVVLSQTLDELRFNVTCDIGAANDIRWSARPSLEDVGEHSLSLTVADSSGETLAEASLDVIVTAADARAGEHVRLLIVGDSLTHATVYPNELARLLNTEGNPRWSMLGTHRPESASDRVAHEGYGGWTWQRFASHYVPDPDGTYKKRSSPFVFLGEDGQPQLDVARYFEESCEGEHPDTVFFLLGINDCFSVNPEDAAAIDERIDAVLSHADTLLTAFRQSVPEAELAVCLPPPPNASQSAFEANYESNYTRWGWKRIQHRLVERMIDHFSDREDDHQFLVPTELYIDPENGYPDNNAVHPNETGYRQLAASMYAWLKSRTQE
ncbi:MAG: sulfatase-like hydrolase/transferase [Planctomycetaceae bacterium]|nr:sulfatase-like hydrolase/transferase [Planctomycetaceae bacterium]